MYLLAVLLLLNALFGGRLLSEEVNLTINVGKQTASPDGRQREVWTYNHQLPGPVIRANKGDKLIIKVNNHLDVPTSIHWHGMYQKGTWQMDGVAWVSSPPIPPEESFTYTFIADPPGTHWYHSHTGVQYSQGLFGPLIVEDRMEKERWKYDREEIMLFNDWFIESSDKIFQTLKDAKAMKTDSEKSPDIGDYPFESVLINGKGRFDPHDNSPLAKFSVKQGETIRFRLINASSTYALVVKFERHPMLVIAADGKPIQPVEVDELPVMIGARYDVLVKTDQPGTHWIYVNNLNGLGGKALLEYEASSEPTLLHKPLAPASQRTLSRTEIKSPTNLNLYDISAKEVHLTLGGQMVPYQWKINGKMFPNTDCIKVEKGEWIRLIIDNPTEMDHPFHIHGHSVYYLGERRNLNLKNPPLIDEILIPAKSNAAILLFADNPGRWFFHCHIEWHLAAGMATVVQYIKHVNLDEANSAPKQLSASPD